jgi:hypothetical protein
MATVEAGQVVGHRVRRTGKASATISKIEAGPRIAFELRCAVNDQLPGFVAENRKTKPLVMVAEGTCKGLTLALCGAGPSLRGTHVNSVDHIFACNSALTYMWETGQRVDAGVAIDQTPRLLEEWANPPKVPYFLASTVDPAVVKHLQAHDCPILFFHSFVGIPNEWDIYNRDWPPGVLVGRGFNVLHRFIHVAEWMGYERIDLYGADHAFGDDDLAHANGEDARGAYENPMIMQGWIDGRRWRTRPDMLMAAVALARHVRDSDGRVRLMGDTLPGALLDKDDEFLDQVCRELAPEERARTIFEAPTNRSQ